MLVLLLYSMELRAENEDSVLGSNSSDPPTVVACGIDNRQTTFTMKFVPSPDQSLSGFLKRRSGVFLRPVRNQEAIAERGA
jgi:hypothetical protein